MIKISIFYIKNILNSLKDNNAMYNMYINF